MSYIIHYLITFFYVPAQKLDAHFYVSTIPPPSTHNWLRTYIPLHLSNELSGMIFTP